MKHGQIFQFVKGPRKISARALLDDQTAALITVPHSHHEIHEGDAYFVEGHVSLNDGENTSYYISLTTPNTTKWGHWTWQITSNGIMDIKVYEGSSGGMANGSRGVIHANNRNINCWSGVHDGGDNKTIVLTDSTASWKADALIGMQVYNQTDGSAAFITDNDATTVTVAALLGGTGNDWDDDDVYEINNSQMVVTVGCTVATTLGLMLTDTAFGGSGFKEDVGGGTSREHEIISRQNTTYLAHIANSSSTNIVTFSWAWYEHTKTRV